MSRSFTSVLAHASVLQECLTEQLTKRDDLLIKTTHNHHSPVN